MRHEYSFGGFGSAPGQLFTPYGLDACVKHVYVCDNGNNRVSVHHASDGRFEAVLGGGSGDAHTLHQPRDCALVTNGAEPSRLIVTEATRLVVLSLPSGAPMQLLRINGARSLWGVCVFAERDSLFRSWHREILSSGVSGEAAAGPLQRTGQVAVVDVELAKEVEHALVATVSDVLGKRIKVQLAEILGRTCQGRHRSLPSSLKFAQIAAHQGASRGGVIRGYVDAWKRDTWIGGYVALLPTPLKPLSRELDTSAKEIGQASGGE